MHLMSWELGPNLLDIYVLLDITSFNNNLTFFWKRKKEKLRSWYPIWCTDVKSYISSFYGLRSWFGKVLNLVSDLVYMIQFPVFLAWHAWVFGIYIYGRWLMSLIEVTRLRYTWTRRFYSILESRYFYAYNYNKPLILYNILSRISSL